MDMFLPLYRIADYSGRSGRREYWMFMALKVIVAMAMGFGLNFLGALTSAPIISSRTITGLLSNITVLLATLLYLLCFLPAEIALTVRRWHDIGNSGWTVLVVLLIGLIPVIGGIAALIHVVAMCWPGDKNVNKYGPPPVTETTTA